MEILVDPDGQPAEWLRLHLGKRHPGVRFQTRGEHVANHRLFQQFLDHTHETEKAESHHGEAEKRRGRRHRRPGPG